MLFNKAARPCQLLWERLVRGEAGGAAGGAGGRCYPSLRALQREPPSIVSAVPCIVNMQFGNTDPIVPCTQHDSRALSNDSKWQRPPAPKYCQAIQPIRLIGLSGGRLQLTLDEVAACPQSKFLSRRFGPRSARRGRRRRGVRPLLASCLPPPCRGPPDPPDPPDPPSPASRPGALCEKLRILTTDNVNQHVLVIKYAVRGKIHKRAKEIEKEIKKGKKHPFDHIIRAGVGDSQALGQQPCDFLRNVVTFAVNPGLMDEVDVKKDVRDRVELLLSKCHAKSAGSITPALGMTLIRKHAAEYITRRDGFPASHKNIFLGAGASDVLKTVLLLFRHKINLKRTGVLLPMPQYPLFSGLLSEMGQIRLDYQLDEDCGWAADVDSMKQAFEEGRKTCRPRVVVIINPGNPTGHVMSKENIAEVIKFAYDHKLFILCDEVYQENIIKKQFFSVKKVMNMMGEPYSLMPMASVMSLSKGWAGEVGFRGSVCEMVNLPPRVQAGAYAVRELMQCPSVLGQFAMDCVLSPPKPGDESYEEFAEYIESKQEFFKRRAAIAESVFNSIPGYSCAPIDGAVFAYPRFEIPQRAREKARELQMHADEFYCFEMVAKIGVLVVPGSGFGQAPGTHHFRTTIINCESDFKYMMDHFKTFHEAFLKEYKD